jgi:glycosyltransferase involved in cell wall biosynthesis
MATPPRIALAHDWLCGFRGGEAVLDRIARIVTADFPASAPPRLYLMTDDGRAMTPAIDALPKATSFLSRIPGGDTKLRRWLLPLYPRAVDGLSKTLAADHAREPIDLLISTSSAAIKGLRPPPGVPHLCYCHSPARYIWSQSEQYSGGLRGLGLRLARNSFQKWDRRTAANVRQFIANSSHTAREIKRCFGRDSLVIHPPARTDFFTPDPAVPREDFWLCVGALEPYKRVDLAIAAAKRAGKRVVIVGSGSHEHPLRGLAGPNVEFLGRVSDEQLRDLYRRAAVLLFPQIEDFGIVAVEAQACGLPVVAAATGGAGGALDSVVHEHTGELVPEPTPDSLADAAARIGTRVMHDPAPWAQRCRDNAERFSEAVFDSKMRDSIVSLLRG